MKGGVARPAQTTSPLGRRAGSSRSCSWNHRQRLSRAAEFLDLVEDQTNRLLHPSIRILLQPVARLDEADRRADDQLAPSRLLVARRERALAQQVESYSLRLPLRPRRSRSLLWHGA